MKMIASENYYLRKKWEIAQINQEIKNEELSRTAEEREAAEKHALEGLEKLRRCIDEHNRSIRYIPDWLGLMIFQYASKAALSTAKYYQLDITIERDDHTGIIQFLGDQILSEEIWNDGKHRRNLLHLIWWADGVCIECKDVYGDSAIHIVLSYKLARETTER